MTFDRAQSIRRLKPQRQAPPLERRPDSQLPFVTTPPTAGGELLLDTCVYLDVMQGRTPAEVDALLQIRTLNHSTVALSEMTHRFGRLAPTHPATRNALRQIAGAIDEIQPHRLGIPSTRAFGEAGMLAGLAARLSGQPSGVELLNDALLFLHARETGRALLTANIAHFDHFDQLLPGNNLLFYRAI